MNDQPFLIATCTFKEREYLVKMNVISGTSLYLCVTDKCSAEDWQCTYDASYIENLTHKTGNYKQFDIFTTMLKSGLLKTSECVTLDLLSYDDLEQLRSHRVLEQNLNTPRLFQLNHAIPNPNRRYLILTYTVEFDRIHYPLPMEYCGSPDPQVLQKIIRRLEAEVARLQEKLKQGKKYGRTDSTSEISHLQKRIKNLEEENYSLKLEIQLLNKKIARKGSNSGELEVLSNTIKMLEDNFLQERISFQKTISQLREERTKLKQQVEELSGHPQYLHQKVKNDRSELKNFTALKRQGGDQQIPISRQPSVRIRSPDLRRDCSRSQIFAPQSRLNIGQMTSSLHNVESETGQKFHKKRNYKTHSHPIVNKDYNCLSNSDSSVSSKGKLKMKTNKSACNVELDGNDFEKLNSRRGRSRERKTKCSSRTSSKSPMESPSLRKRGSRSNDNRRGSTCSSVSSDHSNDRVGKQTSRDPVRTRAPRHPRKNQNLHIGMTDLERRIQALQKVLKDGLSMT